MRAGDLRHRITIQFENGTTTNENGMAVPKWDDLVTVWAEKLPLEGREYWAAASVQQEHNVKWRIRYRKDVTAKMRVFEPANGSTYDIHDVQDVKGLKKELLLITEEVQ